MFNSGMSPVSCLSQLCAIDLYSVTAEENGPNAMSVPKGDRHEVSSLGILNAMPSVLKKADLAYCALHRDHKVL